jgi:hypothetical protein
LVENAVDAVVCAMDTLLTLPFRQLHSKPYQASKQASRHSIKVNIFVNNFSPLKLLLSSSSSPSLYLRSYPYASLLL